MLLISETDGIIANPFVNEKVSKHLLKDLAPFYPLWSSCFKERTSNSNVECWNKIVKKDMLRGEKGLRPATLVRMTRSYTLSVLKFNSLEVRSKPPKQKQPVETWKPKKGKFPGYFNPTDKESNQDLECLWLDCMSTDFDRLKLSNFVFLNFKFLINLRSLMTF